MKIDNLHIVGAGSLGSYTTLLSSTEANVLGCHITVYDNDIVERHNLENQFYRLKDVDKPKVMALKKCILEQTGVEIEIENKKVNSLARIRGIPIILVDTMKSRQEIFLSAIYDAAIPYYIEARTGTQEALVYAFNPRSKDWVERYKTTLRSDSQIRERPCANRDMVPVIWAVATTITKILLKLNGDKVFQNEFLEIVINFKDWPILKPIIIEEL